MSTSEFRRRGRSLADVSKSLKQVPKEAGIAIARGSAPALTRHVGSSWDAGLNAYNETRPLGVGGNVLDLRVTGRARGYLRFIAAGTRLQASLPLKYFRYLIGKYVVLPIGRSPLPRPWLESIAEQSDKWISRKVADG